jgi:hypothetical protein
VLPAASQLDRDSGVSPHMPGICLCVNRQDQQAIDDLFEHLNQTAAQAGPPDAEADARIRQHIKQGPPALVYQMAQTLVGQQAALRQLRAQVADLQQQLQRGGPPAGVAQPGGGGGQPGYGGYGTPYQSYGYQRSGGGGFLAGAGQIALGVGGGILAAEALSDLFGGDGLFGGDRDYSDERAFDQGYEDGRQDQERYDDSRQDDYNQYDDQGQYDGGGGYDDGGGFDGGGFDDGGGW